ncbi:YceD family protein [Desulfoluna spongiiphila]|uniref:YceD family protein n=1 Tax=Desulfoluna spongiiphila TaxID=419481 RepID=UPI001259D9D0|nr:DUF177 domain-containing protein [Desulfoluna spongiiphila]VVS92569.1 large ribosomal rna subunit accumulation protein yced [Desulfoluna spongiiphila]
MILNISVLSDHWSEFSASEPATRYPVLSDLESKGDIRFTSPLAIALSARTSGGQVEVKGTVSVTVEQPCGRCLEPFIEALTAEVDLRFEEEGVQAYETMVTDEVELTEEALTRETFSGDSIDLTANIQDEVIMTLPQNPTCNTDCKGLCRECGKNLNQGACGCDIATGHPAFAKLKVLKGGK